MQQQMYYVSHDSKELGPWTLDQIVEQMKSGSVGMTDYIFDESKQDWVLMMEFGPLNDLLKGKKPKAPPVAQAAKAEPAPEPSPQGDEWYVLKWENRYGPFTHLDIVKMLQEKSVFEFDYVWKPGMEEWKRVAEVHDFTPDRIRHLKGGDMPELSEVFFRRRHVRTKFNGSIIVHDAKNVWKGESFEISEGGAGIVMHNSLVLPGQKVYIHFKPGDSVPPFNAVCEIVSKQYMKGVKHKDAPVGYGVKFLEINGEVQKAIRQYTTKKAA